MTAKLFFLEAIAVVSGAIIGALVFLVAHWLLVNGAVSTGGLSGVIVALVTVIIFAVYYHYLSQTPAALASFFTGFLLPAIAAGIVIGGEATTAGALIAYGVFSLASLLIYRFVFASISGRDIGPDLVRRPQDAASPVSPMPPVPPAPPAPPRRPGEPL
jgi:hypothetical protein